MKKAVALLVVLGAALPVLAQDDPPVSGSVFSPLASEARTAPDEKRDEASARSYDTKPAASCTPRPSTVPEPASVVLLVLGGILLRPRRK